MITRVGGACNEPESFGRFFLSRIHTLQRSLRETATVSSNRSARQVVSVRHQHWCQACSVAPQATGCFLKVKLGIAHPGDKLGGKTSICICKSNILCFRSQMFSVLGIAKWGDRKASLRNIDFTMTSVSNVCNASVDRASCIAGVLRSRSFAINSGKGFAPRLGG